MLPVTSPSDANGDRKVFAIASIDGLTEWVDYIPVQAADELVASANRADALGYDTVNSLDSSDNLTAWVDYIPVYVVADRTTPWHTGPDGYIPVLAITGSLGGAPSGLTSLGTFLKDTGMIASSARGVAVSPDGTKIIWDDTGANLFKGATMTTPHDPTSGTQDTSRAEYQANNFGLTVSPDGTKFISSPVNGTDYGDMSTGWDVDTLAGRSFTTGLTGGNIHTGLAFNDDGTKVYLGTTTEATSVKAFTCVTPYDVSSVVDYGTPDELLVLDPSWEQPDNLNLTGQIDFTADGTTCFVCFANLIMGIPLATAWDVSTATAPLNVLAVGTAITGIHWDRTNDDALWVMHTSDVVRYSAFTDPSPAAGATEGKPMNQMLQNKKSTGMFNSTSGVQGIAWKPDGTQYIIHNTHNSWAQYETYDCSVAWDADTAVYDGTKDLAEDIFFPTATLWNDDGSRLIVADANEVGYYDCSTEYDLSTAGSYVTHAMTAGGVAFNADGTIMYVTTVAEDLVEYSLSTPYLPSSKSLTSTTDIEAMLAHSQSTASNPTWIAIDGSGTRMYIVGHGRYINELYLSTAWDSSTAVKVGRTNYMQAATVGGMFLRQDTGSALYTCAADDVYTWEYTG